MVEIKGHLPKLLYQLPHQKKHRSVVRPLAQNEKPREPSCRDRSTGTRHQIQTGPIEIYPRKHTCIIIERSNEITY